jgi:hypothetical protein
MDQCDVQSCLLILKAFYAGLDDIFWLLAQKLSLSCQSLANNWAGCYGSAGEIVERYHICTGGEDTKHAIVERYPME